MKAFSDRNPIAIFIFFAAVTVITMFCVNPVIAALSLCGALSLWFVRNAAKDRGGHLFSLALFAVISLANPIFSHNGLTVLFVVNNNPVTLEALYYGMSMGLTVVSVLYWMRSFVQIMTSDKLMYLFGKISPKAALVFSMALGYVPLLRRQAKRTNDALRATGMYGDENIAQSVRGGARVFSAVVTKALENGIITADSMTARGYGIGRRTSFAIFRFGRSDVSLALISAAFAVAVVAGIASGKLDFEFYPAIKPPGVSALTVVSYLAYGLLSAVPTIIEVRERIRWRYLRSRVCHSAIRSAAGTR